MLAAQSSPASYVVGLVALALGSICIVAGVAVAVLRVLQKQAGDAGFLGVKDTLKLLGVLKDLVLAFGKLQVEGQLFVVGLVLCAGGIWLLEARPF